LSHIPSLHPDSSLQHAPSSKLVGENLSLFFICHAEYLKRKTFWH
jgi:hypothetical protein